MEESPQLRFNGDEWPKGVLHKIEADIGLEEGAGTNWISELAEAEIARLEESLGKHAVFQANFPEEDEPETGEE